MGSLLLVSAAGPERRVALVEHGVTTDVMMQPRVGERLVGNIYRGRVVRVLPGMQSAFVEIGLRRTAFLYAGDLVGDQNGDAPGVAMAPPPINERLTEGQDLIVQVAKEPMGTKGARVTSHVTLPGRHIVYMPTVKHVGVSRRIADPEERDRLRTAAESICPEQGGLIVRTVGEGFGAEDFQEDVAFLEALWRDIVRRAKTVAPPALLHCDLDLALMATRDLLRPDFEALIVDDPGEHARLAEFLEAFMPGCRSLLKLDEASPPLFTRFGVEHELSRAMDRKVWLKSGGYIVIDQTEALTAIDVNTGRYVGKTNFEDTVLKINLEAMREIAYQLRLRNIGGIIVIDFIDMANAEARTQVYDSLRESLSHDKVRTRVLPMSQLGLIEMTRKRTRESLTQAMAQPCDGCDGRGWTLSSQEVARQVLARIRDTISSRRQLKRVDVGAHQTVIDALREDYWDQIEVIHAQTGVDIAATPRDQFHVEHYEVKGR